MKDRNGMEHKGKGDGGGQFVGNGNSTEAEKRRAAELTSDVDNSVAEDISDLLGEEFTGVKGQDAIHKLIAVQRGHVKGAFHREDIGDVDLIWGNDDIGLQHIIKQRTEQGIDSTAFVSTVADTVNHGELRTILRRDRETGITYTSYEIIKNRQVVVVQPEFKGNKFSFIVTAFRTRKASWENHKA